MSKVSAARKLASSIRLISQQTQRSRLGRATTHAAATTARALGGVAHQLWLEVTGVVFLIMALSFAGGAFKEYNKFHTGQAGSSHFAIALCATLTFAWFGLSSFWRVKNKKKRAAKRG